MTTRGITRNTLPSIPGRNSSGLKAATVVRTANVHRPRDLVRPLDGPAHPVAVLLLVPVDVLAHDDGVVDHDAEHQDEAEQRQHVDGDVEAQQQREGVEERDRDAEAHPECQTKFQDSASTSGLDGWKHRSEVDPEEPARERRNRSERQFQDPPSRAEAADVQQIVDSANTHGA